MNRSGFTAIGPQIRYAPVEAWENFLSRVPLYFQFEEDLAGGPSNSTYIDWSGSTWNTQLFMISLIGNSFSLLQN